MTTRRGAMQSLDMFAVAAPGLEGVLAAELAELGIHGTVEAGGVGWQGPQIDLHRANLHLRTASRILVRVAQFRARSFIEMERHARRISWMPFLPAGSSAALRVTSRKSSLYHEGAIAERFARWIGEDTGVSLEKAAVDDETGPEGPAHSPEQLVVVRFLRDNCLVSVDSSGFLLHRRGYRLATAKAPLRETLAAALIRLAGWQGGTALLDPLCGSGTIPIESVLIARNIPPGLALADRSPPNYAFLRWAGFDPAPWEGVLTEARSAIRDHAPAPIVGSDRDEGAITAALANAKRAGVDEDIEFDVRALSVAERAAAEGWLITNPPYGVRVGEAPPLRNLYAALGNLLSTRFVGWRLAMMSADPILERATGLDLVEVARTRNGGIPVRVMIQRGGEPT